MVVVDRERCTGCGSCERDCVGQVIRVTDGKATAPSDCLKCGHCVAICPVGAVSIPEYDMADVEEYDAEHFRLAPDTLLRFIKYRRSVRDFLPKKIEDEKLNMLFQAGRYTATAKNNQDCLFILVQERQAELEALVWKQVEAMIGPSRSETAPENRPFITFLRRYQRDVKDDYLFRNAPAVLFIASDWQLDAGLAAQNIELMAVAQGLGVQYNGFLQRLVDQSPEVKAWLGASGKAIKACMLLGYPGVKYQRTAPRRAAQVLIK